MKQARERGADLLISNEVLSHLLAHPRSERPEECIGDWLVRQFQRRGCAVTLVAFLRDQPSYLNSHYAQQIRNFSLHCSFEAYAEAVMNNLHSRGQCDPERLFGSSGTTQRSRPTFSPTTATDAAIRATHRDPRPSHCGDGEAMKTVGSLAVATSIRVQEDLKKRSIRLSSKPSRRRDTCPAAPLPALPLGTGSFQWRTPLSADPRPLPAHERPLRAGGLGRRQLGRAVSRRSPICPGTAGERSGVEWESRDLVRRLTATQQKAR